MVHKHKLHELTMVISLSKQHRGNLKISIFVYQACWLIYMDILTSVTFFYFLLNNLSKLLHVAFLLPVNILTYTK